MSIKKEVLSYLKENREYFKNKYGIKEIYLFGSVARGEDTQNSDIDLMVEFEDFVTFRHFVGFKNLLENKFKRKVDIATPDMIKPIMWKYVNKDLIDAR